MPGTGAWRVAIWRNNHGLLAHESRTQRRCGVFFFLAIPTMFGASAYSLYKHWSELHSSDFLVLGIGFVVAFVSAYYVAKLFLTFVANNGFAVFAWYRIFVGTLLLSYLFTKEIVLA